MLTGSFTSILTSVATNLVYLFSVLFLTQVFTGGVSLATAPQNKFGPIETDTITTEHANNAGKAIRRDVGTHLKRSHSKDHFNNDQDIATIESQGLLADELKSDDTANEDKMREKTLV